MTEAQGLTPDERKWLVTQTDNLVEFARAAAHPDGGFGWLDETGTLDPSHAIDLWITCRMTHVFALSVLRGDESSRPLLEHGVAALTGLLHDDTHGGWFAAVDPLTGSPVNTAKEAYGHAFVVLAAASASAAGAPGARDLLDRALGVVETRFWRERDGLVVDTISRDFAQVDPYRGVNANMHTVEALLAAHDVTGDPVTLRRVERIVRRVVGEFARGNDWRLPEHFDQHWSPLLDYNRDEPAHPFRPFGVTIGHLIEWARLSIHLATALEQASGEVADGESNSVSVGAVAELHEWAGRLMHRAITEGFEVDGAEGFVYTTDFAGVPVVRERMHWVVAEAIAASWAMWRATDDPEHLAAYRRWVDLAVRDFIDPVHGSWHHELDPDNRVSATVWSGKPDVYHAYQALLFPLLPQSGSFVGSFVGVAAADPISD